LRRSLLGLAIAALVFSLTTQPALAAAPSRESVSEPADLAAGTACSFAVQVGSVKQNETATTFSNGRVLITGASIVKLTNVSTGKSIVVNASGPVSLIFGATSLTATARGRTMVSFRPGDVGPFVPGLVVTTGLVRLTIDLETGRITSFTHSGGTTENLCDALS
jgi:hypothetical protein